MAPPWEVRLVMRGTVEGPIVAPSGLDVSPQALEPAAPETAA
jgi:hypothetical protein